MAGARIVPGASAAADDDISATAALVVDVAGLVGGCRALLEGASLHLMLSVSEEATGAEEALSGHLPLEAQPRLVVVRPSTIAATSTPLAPTLVAVGAPFAEVTRPAGRQIQSLHFRFQLLRRASR